jgi:hypothetical protein
MEYPTAILKRPKAGGFINHIGVLLSNGLVAHNSPEKGEHIGTLDEFAKGQNVTVIAPVNESAAQQAQLALRQVRVTPKRYDAVNNNCEHFANRILGKPAESPQLQAILAITLLASIFVLIGCTSKR